MDQLAALRLFLRAADAGSFSRAAAAERCQVSTVSRAILALEEDLGAALFNRSTRHLQLTEAGSRFRDGARLVLDDLEQARAAVTSLDAAPRGLLKLNLPTAFGRRHVLPVVAELQRRHPELAVEAMLTDATLDLVATGADVAIRIGALPDSTLVARRLAPQRRVPCGAPALLERLAPVVGPEDLAARPCLTLALQPTDKWYFRREAGPARDGVEVPVAGRFVSNDSEALRDAALEGLGIALLPTWLVGPDIAAGALRPLLPEWRADIAPGPERAISALHTGRRLVSPKVRVFIDALAAAIGSPPYWDAFAADDGLTAEGRTAPVQR
ncbi:LysR family transcriptional regulator [Lichenibacterium ramalinae]|uniref:LysR family transcriptional regulator n=1 Tax=Lichenibacterium ramalinae TaxID=2316527 RepID=A0A4Q2RC61_9HYPH|nr:LysR family transcriptional regulator [Lichenibacterium ramalinae]RYB04146.1 LysR family transcriptional regulator [Lichenibacterium ramalinae]